ncbi:MAG: amino acid ABC transporter substrate-binding protein [Proteobacteria bacterium]|nr:amino acid ABC transporter substrate-binding protein [Pseudomonadota bacterium]
MFKKFIAIAAVAGSAALLPGFAQAADVKIGYSISRTGFLASAVSVQEQAYILWREQVNARGGLNIGGKEKRMIADFVSYDDQTDAGKIPQIYEKLVGDDKVDLLLPPYATFLHVAITGVVEKHRIPVVGNTASSVLIRDLGAKYMFFTEILPDDYSAVVVDFLKDQGLKRAALLTLQTSFTLEMKKFTKPLLKKAGIELVIDQEYPFEIKDFTSIVSGIKQSKVDTVIGYTYPADSIMYMDKARELNVTSPFQFLLIGPSIPFFHAKYGKNLDGMVSVGHWVPNGGWTGAQAFHDAYSKRWKEKPDYLDSVIAYVSLQILEEGVAKAGLDREKLRDAIASGTFDTIMGQVKFKNNNNVMTSGGLLQYQNGVNEIIWPPAIATAKFIKKPNWQ